MRDPDMLASPKLLSRRPGNRMRRARPV